MAALNTPHWIANQYVRVLGFFATEMDFGRKICLAVQERDRKARFKKASVGRGLHCHK